MQFFILYALRENPYKTYSAALDVNFEGISHALDKREAILRAIYEGHDKQYYTDVQPDDILIQTMCRLE